MDSDFVSLYLVVIPVAASVGHTLTASPPPLCRIRVFPLSHGRHSIVSYMYINFPRMP